MLGKLIKNVYEVQFSFNFKEERLNDQNKIMLGKNIFVL